jgi:hypothetical protein
VKKQKKNKKKKTTGLGFIRKNPGFFQPWTWCRRVANSSQLSATRLQIGAAGNGATSCAEKWCAEMTRTIF